MAFALPHFAVAQVTVGVTLPLTGPAAVLGIGAKTAVSMMPDHVGGTAVRFVVLDDASDVTNAVVNANKLISQHKVDVILGSGTSPQVLAMIDPVSDSKTPLIAFGSSRFIVEPMDAKRHWVFKPNPSDGIWITGLIGSWKKKGIRTLAFLGFDDAYGESILTELQAQLRETEIKLVGVERFGSRDMSVAAQALKIIAFRPEAVVIAASGTPALLPQTTLKDRGYKGLIYQNNPAATPEFLRNGGARVEGTFVVTGPCLVHEQLPAENPVKAPCSEFVGRYEAANGPNSRSLFAYQAYDAWALLAQAIPVAAAKAKPGTPEFRAELRDALEGTRELAGDSGVFNMTPANHMGLDSRATAIVEVVDNKWRLVP
jgi:branched-chain amino acid transport system substrate-binding protein